VSKQAMVHQSRKKGVTIRFTTWRTLFIISEMPCAIIFHLRILKNQNIRKATKESQQHEQKLDITVTTGFSEQV
jgi:hypothetical protein